MAATRSATRAVRRAAGVDPFGLDPALCERIRPVTEFLYRRYWRVHTDGIENIPTHGAALIIANHSGGIPLDAGMIAAAIDLEHPQHRLVRYLYDRFVAKLPVVRDVYNRLGAAVASYENARRLLERGDLVGIFPEGVAGIAKNIWHRYELQPFHTGFIRLSLSLRAPIIPAAVVGAEETYPVIGKWDRLGPLRKVLKVPYVPVTPLFPFFGPIGLIPLPTKWHIRFAPPIRFYTDPGLCRPEHEPTTQELAGQVRRQIQAMLHDLLAERESIF
jgi:1-acyl-sn-glycerol-3-phosphate acyltransferase